MPISTNQATVWPRNCKSSSQTPQPKDISTTRQLVHYKNLAPRWHDWRAVTAVCHQLAERMLEG